MSTDKDTGLAVVAWAMTHTHGQTLLHTPAEAPLAYRDTCTKQVPLVTLADASARIAALEAEVERLRAALKQANHA